MLLPEFPRGYVWNRTVRGLMRSLYLVRRSPLRADRDPGGPMHDAGGYATIGGAAGMRGRRLGSIHGGG